MNHAKRLPAGILMLIALTVATTATAGTITGVVVDRKRGTPVPFATIKNAAGDIATAADEQGRFHIEVPGEMATLHVSQVSYQSRKLDDLSAGTEHRITMTPAISVLNTVVVSGNRGEREAYRVALPVVTATDENIQAKGHTIVSDVIRDLPGVDMNESGPFRSRPVIRGMFGSRILVLVDGVRLNDHRDAVEFGGAGLSLLDANEIERIEVVSGAGSVLYGSDAMGGVINVITGKNRYAESLSPWATYTSRYSSADRQSSNRVDLGVANDRWTLSGGILYREADKDYAVPDGLATADDRYGVYGQDFYNELNSERGTSFGTDRLANSQARVNNFDGHVGYRLNGHHRLSADFGSFRANDIGFPGVPNDSTPFLFVWPRHDREHASVTYTGSVLSETLARMEAKVYYEETNKEFLTDFYDNISFPAGPGAFGYPMTSRSETQVRKFGATFQQLYRFTDETKLTVGVDAWRSEIDGRNTSTTRFEGFGPFPVFDTSLSASVPENTWDAVGGYAIGDFHLGDLSANVGVRWDNFSVSAKETPGYVGDDDEPLPAADESYSAVNGSIGLVYPIGTGVNAVLSTGTAYRVPNAVERFFHGSASGRQTRPNPDIKAERAITTSAGFKGIHPLVNYSVIGFYSDYSEFSQLENSASDPTTHQPLWRYENVEDVVIYGAEALFELQHEGGWYGSAAVSVQRGENRTDDQPLFVSPFKTALTAGYREERHGLFGEVDVVVAADQNRVPVTAALDDIATRGYSTVGATVGVELNDRIRLSVTGNNLLDEVYSEPFNGRNPDNPIPEPGRNIVVSLRAGIGR